MVTHVVYFCLQWINYFPSSFFFSTDQMTLTKNFFSFFSWCLHTAFCHCELVGNDLHCSHDFPLQISLKSPCYISIPRICLLTLLLERFPVVHLFCSVMLHVIVQPIRGDCRIHIMSTGTQGYGSLCWYYRFTHVSLYVVRVVRLWVISWRWQSLSTEVIPVSYAV